MAVATVSLGSVLKSVKAGQLSPLLQLSESHGQRLLGQADRHGETPLHVASKEGHAAIVQFLLRSGVTVDHDRLEELLASTKPQEKRRSQEPGNLPKGILSSPLDSVASAPWQEPSTTAPSTVPRSLLPAHAFDAIDLAPFVHRECYSDDDRMRSAKLWDHCFRTLGFGLVEGHGIPLDCIEDLRKAAMCFFKQASDYKYRFNHGPTMTGKSGYSPLRDSRTPETAHSDPVEGYTFIRPQKVGRGTSLWMDSGERHPEELEGIGQRYCNEVERVMDALHRMSALALGLEEDYFEKFYTKPASVVVMSHYPPLKPLKPPDGKPRYRAHSDYSGFTVLLQDEADFGPGGGAGLEIDIAGHWVPVKPQKGTLVVNIGDLFELWTNDRWRSTPHRVTSPKLTDPAAGQSRFTTMLFSGPNLDATIAPIRTCVDEKHPSRYSSMTAAQHLAAMWKTKSKEARYK